jgi:GNAT superfamily N-acetyltransferase
MGALDRLTANQRSWMEAVAAATGGSTLEVDGVACVHQPLPHRELIVPFPRRSPTATLVDRARELGAQRVGCWTAGRDLDLSELGFHPGWEPHWMAAPTCAVALDPRVSEVDEVPEYDDYGQRLLALARTRESHLFVAREDGRFAGHAWLHVAAGVGGLFDVFVVDAFRRRGLGSALSLAASAKAAEAGIGTLTLNAEFEPLYRALGFQSLGRGQTWWRHHL